MNSTLRLLVAAPFITILAAACGDKGGGGSTSASAAATGGKVASCDAATKFFSCKEYGPKNVEAAGMDFLKKLCSPEMGEFKEAACPTAKIIGTCTSSEGKSIYYEGYPGTMADAEKTCKVLSGTFSTK